MDSDAMEDSVFSLGEESDDYVPQKVRRFVCATLPTISQGLSRDSTPPQAH